MSYLLAYVPALLLAIAIFSTPVGLIVGWIRWVKRRRELGSGSKLSLLAFGLATAAALLTVAFYILVAVRPYLMHDPNASQEMVSVPRAGEPSAR
jgi:heme/copper-type cytochrome/quinol oxidase subunit 1